MGNEKIGRAFNYRSFAEARSFVHTLKLKDTKEWLQYRKGTLKGYERRPLDHSECSSWSLQRPGLAGYEGLVGE